MNGSQQLHTITERISQRSTTSRAQYLKRMSDQHSEERPRMALSCSNIAHAFAAESGDNKNLLLRSGPVNLGIITAYNDMLSAHQPYVDYPQQIKTYAQQAGAVAQVAAGVPAMCDGITQGTDSMQISLFSRDAIAMSAAIGLSHNVYDGVIYLGICDKIVPGLLIAALSFGHIPALFIPSGPMEPGLPNKDKAAVRQAYAAGTANRDDLLQAEMGAYHSAGTCTFYGTANSNQMLLECMGLQLPGSSFVLPGTTTRRALTKAAVNRIIAISNQGEKIALRDIINEKSLVNAMAGLLATGGSTNHTLHLVAIAKAAGIEIHWQDFADMAEIIPLLAQVYPNGAADVNAFRDAGGVNYIIGSLLDAGLMHGDVTTIVGQGLQQFATEPTLGNNTLTWKPAINSNPDIVRPVDRPFQKTGGIQLLKGNLGESVIKVSAVDPSHRHIKAPAKVFASQQAFMDAFERGTLNCDHIAVVRFQGPSANGMPELHKLTPLLGNLQDQGHCVALVTDGRMSGASGKVPAAIHLTPEAAEGGAIARIEDGDLVELDCTNGTLTVHVDSQTLQQRSPGQQEESVENGSGRELFQLFRKNVGSAATGATIFS